MDDFDFFPELNEKSAETQVAYDSEEDALDAAVSEKQNTAVFEEAPDPQDPGASREMIPVPVPDPCNASPAAEFSETAEKPLTIKDLRRIAFAFLASKEPDAAGMAIPSGISGYMLDAVSIKFSAKRSVSEIDSSAIVIAAESLESCLMPESKKNALEKERSALLETKAALEAQAREKEPYLNESLFVEEPEWHYEKTSVRAYHQCLKKLEKTDFILTHSGKLDRLMAEQTANHYYILLPDTVTDYSPVPEGWGILIADPGYKVTVIREAAAEQAKPERNQALAAMIARNTWKDSLFVKGIAVKDGQMMFSAAPRKRPVKYRA